MAKSLNQKKLKARTHTLTMNVLAHSRSRVGDEFAWARLELDK